MLSLLTVRVVMACAAMTVVVDFFVFVSVMMMHGMVVIGSKSIEMVTMDSPDDLAWRSF